MGILPFYECEKVPFTLLHNPVFSAENSDVVRDTASLLSTACRKRYEAQSLSEPQLKHLYSTLRAPRPGDLTLRQRTQASWLSSAYVITFY